MQFKAMRSCAWFLSLLALIGCGNILFAGTRPQVDLAEVSTEGSLLHRLRGSAGDGLFGVPVAGGKDCDGDGHADLIMAAMLASPMGRSGAGEVYVEFGDGTTTGESDTAVASANILRIAGDTTLEMTGTEVWMDDVTGDEIADLLIGRQNHRPDMMRPGAGALTIIVGGAALKTHAATLEYLDLRTPPEGITITTLIGANAVDRFGIWMRTGDIDGDEIADIVVGADQEDGESESNRGAVYVIRGGAHLAMDQTIDLADFGDTTLDDHLAKITPPTGSEDFHFGSTCQLADLDANGHAEVMASAALLRGGASVDADGAPANSAENRGGSTHGTLFIAWDDNFPATPWDAGYSFAMDTAPGTTSSIGGGSLNLAFGEEIIGGLDWDNDGNADLFVGDIIGDLSPLQDRFWAGSGHVLYHAATFKGKAFTLDSAPPDLKTTTFLGAAPGNIASDTAIQGDFDGDGIADLGFSSPHDDPLDRDDAGTLHIFFGQTGVWPEEIDLGAASLPDVSLIRITEVHGALGSVGSDHGDVLAYSATSADIDKDGRDDIILNEMLGNGTAVDDVGNLLVLNGRVFQ